MADVLDKPAGLSEPAPPPKPVPDIVVRDFRFGLAAAPVRHWLGGDMFRTVVGDALSIFLPTGERFFIRAVKHHAPKIQDPVLARSIQDFARQESYHTREHEDYNRAMELLGYDVPEMEKPVKEVLKAEGRAVQSLATTCAVEHITASISHLVLSRNVLHDADDRYRRLWTWHALEELEHKAVALDVFNVVTRNWKPYQRYLFRNIVMTVTLWRFVKIFFRSARIYTRHDGLESRSRFAMGMFKVLLVKPGYWRHGIWAVLAYYRPGFDARHRDDGKLIAEARAELERTKPFAVKAG